MIIDAFKFVKWIFPFLQELFISKKNPRKKKNISSNYNTWIKNTVIVVGLLSFIGVFYIGKAYLEIKKELVIIREKKEKETKSPEPIPTSNDDPPDEKEHICDNTDHPNHDIHPKKKIANTTKKNQKDDLIEKLKNINAIGQ